MEIITGVERRRRWRVAEKLRIVAEIEQAGAGIAEIARRYEISRGLLWNWRSRVRRGDTACGTGTGICAGAGEQANQYLANRVSMPGRPHVRRCDNGRWQDRDHAAEWHFHQDWT